MKTPKQVYSIKGNIIFVFVLALFVILFDTLYTPTFGHPDWQLYRDHASLCIPITSAIVLLVGAISRTILLVTCRRGRLSEVEYLLWQIMELVVISLCIGIFVSLLFHKGYFELLPSILGIVFTVLIYPYIIYWLFTERLDRDVRIAEAQRSIMELRRGLAPSESGVVRFIDEKGSVKFVVSVEKVISIEAAGNYVTILYDNGGKLMRYNLRNTLKGIESICLANDLLRCHRSYFVNIRHVKLLRKEGEVIFAELDVNGVDDIPVSKMYATELFERFGAH